MTYDGTKSATESYKLFKINASGADASVEPSVKFLAKQTAGSLSSRDWLEMPRKEFKMKNVYQYMTEQELNIFKIEKGEEEKT